MGLNKVWSVYIEKLRIKNTILIKLKTNVKMKLKINQLFSLTAITISFMRSKAIKPSRMKSSFQHHLGEKHQFEGRSKGDRLIHQQELVNLLRYNGLLVVGINFF